VLCIDDANVREIAPLIAKPIVTYGLADDAQVRADDVANVGGRMRFVARSPGAAPLPVELNLAGVHNVRNALAAIAVGREVGVADAAIAQALAEFRGVARRFQRHPDVAVEGGGTFALIDDYGHHPVEIAAVLRAARQATQGGVIAVVQPHRYTRLKNLFAEFCACFNDADAVIVADVYAAGETPIEGADRDALVEGLRAHGHRRVLPLADPKDLAATVIEIARPGDLVVCLGAGSISAWAYALPAELAALAPGGRVAGARA
jgi:UDP-N-acetylmuramate--alanine ligase